MSSSGGERGAVAVVKRPWPFGELFGDVVLWGLQFMEIGPRLLCAGSEIKNIK